MSRTFFVCLWGLVFLSQAAWAELPFDVERQFTFPAWVNWDVQYLTDDSTLARVWSAGTTISWVIGDSPEVQTFTLPPSMIPFYGPPVSGSAVHWVKVAAAPTQPCVLWRASFRAEEIEQDYYDQQLLCLINLATGQRLDYSTCYGNSSYSNGSAYTDVSRGITQVQCWPPLPAVTQYLLLSEHIVTTGYRPGDIWIGSESGNGSAINLQVSGLPDEVSWVFMRERLQPFAGSTTPLIAFSSTFADFSQSPQHYGPYVGTWHLGTGVVTRDSLHGEVAMPQQDAAGTRRLLTADGSALDPTTFAPLWQNPALAGALSMRLNPGGDEYFLDYSASSHRCQIYRPQDGALSDSTLPIGGTPVAVLKGGSAGDALLTREGASGQPQTVRVYRFGPPRPTDLVVRYLPETDEIELSWTPIAGVSGYRVRAGDLPATSDTVLGDVPATQTIFLVPATSAIRFFSVSARY